jgi:hypothetical protein
MTPPSLAQKLAEFFRSHPGEWIDGRRLAGIAGSYAWRTRVSDLRRPPFHMRIENRQRRADVDGHRYTISEYRFIEESHKKTEEVAAVSVAAPAAAV